MTGLLQKIFARNDRRRRRSMSQSPVQVMQALFTERPIRTVFDIGANFGSFSEQVLKDLAPQRIYAFEPIKTHFENLCKKWPEGGLVIPVRMAMGNRSGTVDFNINSDPSYNHSLLNKDARSDGWANVEHVAVEQVDCETVDNFCMERGIQRIDILKVDTEGADLMVLQGADSMLRDQAIDLVYVEILMKPLFDGQGSLRQFLEVMEGHGYVFINIFETRTNHVGQLTLANAMFAAPGLVASTPN